MDTKHDKVHLLIISETGKVKSRKISTHFLKWIASIFFIIFLVTSVFTYLYLREFQAHITTKKTSTSLQKELDRLRNKIDEQQFEIDRLKGTIARLNKENQDLKHHILSKKPPPKPPVSKPESDKNLSAYRNFIDEIMKMRAASANIYFHIREPKIVVTPHETKISFKLYKDTLKRVYGRYLLVGLYKPEDPEKVGYAVAFPTRGISNFTLRPGYGRFFKIERRFLTVEAKLPHPEGVSRFTEFHVFIFGKKKELLFHEQFKAP